LAHEDDKKKKIRERNKRNWMIFQHAELHREQVDIAAPEIQAKTTSEKVIKQDEKVWSAQLTTIRNRLDNSRRTSNDRWNRFAGTSDGGGRGR
jgi:Zn-dependent metalloprotease